jgi:hypothetical protein
MMFRRLLLSLGILLLVLGLTLLGVANGYVDSTSRMVRGAVTGFEAAGFFYKDETMVVIITTPHDWAHLITDSVTVFLNFSFIASDGGSVKFRVAYDAWTIDVSGRTLQNPELDLINVSMTGSSGDAPVSQVSASKLANEGLLGGTVLRDGNVTVALDSQTTSNNFGSSTAPKIALRADKTLFPYGYLWPLGVASTVLAVPFLVLSWQKSGRRHSG